MAKTMVDDNTVQSYVNSYLDAHLPELLKNYQQDERGRIVRVEDGIRSQGKLLEKMLQQMDKRFEQVDKRFEFLTGQMDKRFEQVDKHFEQVDKRFETVDKRFETLTDQLNQRFNHMFRFMSLGFVVLTVLMTLYQYL